MTISTVGELIEQLKKFDASLPVLMVDSEGDGYRDLYHPIQCTVKERMFEVQSFMAKYTDCPENEGFKAVVL